MCTDRPPAFTLKLSGCENMRQICLRITSAAWPRNQAISSQSRQHSHGCFGKPLFRWGPQGAEMKRDSHCKIPACHLCVPAFHICVTFSTFRISCGSKSVKTPPHLAEGCSVAPGLLGSDAPAVSSHLVLSSGGDRWAAASWCCFWV